MNKYMSRAEVIVPTNTFSASVSTIIHNGGRPVLTDVDIDNGCITLDEVKKHYTSRTSAVVAVHIGGLVCPEIMEIKEFCEDNDLFLIEDCAHACGSMIDGRYAGTIGDVGCFSFYPTKVMTTCEGGMVISDNQELIEKAKCWRDHGRDKDDVVKIVDLGYNMRLNEISACIGLKQLERLDEIIARRNDIARYYNGNVGVPHQNVYRNIYRNNYRASTNDNILNCYYKYPIFVWDRDEVKRRLREDYNIYCPSEVYDPPIHLQPYYQKYLGTVKGQFPNAEWVAKYMLCLPIYPDLKRDEMVYVMDSLKEVLQ